MHKNLNIIIFISILFITNLFIAGSFELSFDEAYYWIYSKHMSFGYYDHPPMVALFIKLGESLFQYTEIGVRLFFNIAMCASIWILWCSTERKNVTSFIVLTLSMPLMMFSGILALPDTPLLFFSIIFFASLKRYLEVDNLKNSLFVCVSILGMFYAKYHGLLIILLTVIACRSLLKRKSFWLVALGVLIGYLPHIYWQYTHDFVSFKFHLTGRVEKHFDVNNIINYIFSQIGLMGIFAFIILFKRVKSFKHKTDFEKILIFNTIGFFAFLFLMSFRNQIEANWTVSCSAAMIILLTDTLSVKERGLILKTSFIPVGIGILLKILIVFPGAFLDLNKESRVNEIIGWQEERIPQIVALCEDRKIVADSYQIASKLSFYLKKEITALHFGSRESHYNYINPKIKPEKKVDICYLTSKKLNDRIKVESGYKDPVFVLNNVTLEDILNRYKVSYEEVFRNRN